MRVRIGYSDGRYSYWVVRDGAKMHPCDVEVPESTVAMWDAISRTDSEVQAQLRGLDCDRILAMEDDHGP